MDNLSPYELAQQRIEQRQRRETHTLVWLWLAAICVLLAFVAGSWVLLLVIISVFFALSNGIEWYTSRYWTPPLSQVEQEMEWLFGDSWQTAAGVDEFSMALQRIDKRRMAQKKFAFHLGCFLLANVFIFGLGTYNLKTFNTPGPVLALMMLIVWLMVVVYHFASVFPTQRRLIQREQQAGAAMQPVLEMMQQLKLNKEDRLKIDTYYVVGDDGELVEVDNGDKVNTDVFYTVGDDGELMEVDGEAIESDSVSNTLDKPPIG